MIGEVLLGDAMSKNSFLGGIESCPHLGLIRRYIYITSHQSILRYSRCLSIALSGQCCDP